MLEVVDLTCERGERSLFSGLSFAAPSGTLLRIAGPNGTGKTSLLKLMAGIYSPTSGRCEVQGRRVSLLDMTSAYAVFANEGVKIPPVKAR